MAQFQTRPAKGLDKVDPVWARIRSEAEEIARREPEFATFIYENVLHHDTLEAAVIHRVSDLVRGVVRVDSYTGKRGREASRTHGGTTSRDAGAEPLPLGG